jgi:hypothetical protein
LNSKIGIFLLYTIKTGIAGTTHLMALTGRISVFTVMTMSTAGGFSETISRGKVGADLMIEIDLPIDEEKEKLAQEKTLD